MRRVAAAIAVAALVAACGSEAAGRVWRDGGWEPIAATMPHRDPSPPLPWFPFGEVVAATRADLDGDGNTEIVVSYRHPARSVPWDPGPLPTDRAGRSWHLGVVAADGRPRWLGHRIPAPVADLVACGDVVLLALSGMDDPAIVGVAPATWNGFGFWIGETLPGPATIGCADTDGDGRDDPVVMTRG